MTLSVKTRVSHLILGVLILLPGCAGRKAPEVMPPEALASAAYQLQPGAILEVKFPYHPSETQRVVVRPDGGITLAVTGDLQVSGLTVEEVEALIRSRASQFLRDPVVNITVVEPGARVYVGGEVTNPGFLALVKPTTVLQGILERGGYKDSGDLSKVVVVSRSAGIQSTRQVDVKSTLNGESPDGLILAADDIVIVPKTRIAKAGSIVDRYINALTPDIFRAFRAPAI